MGQLWFFHKGDRIQIIKSPTFEAMGFKKVSGTVFLLHDNGNISFRCDQTGAMEIAREGEGIAMYWSKTLKKFVTVPD